MALTPALDWHYAPRDFRDRFAYACVKLLRICADTFFARRYGHRAVVLETVAAVPGMVGGLLQHLRALRRMKSDHGWIRTFCRRTGLIRMYPAGSVFRGKSGCETTPALTPALGWRSTPAQL
jgi:ubiquinol oxidase